MEKEFVEKFIQIWNAPSAEKLVAALHKDVVLYQPILPPLRGKEAILEDFKEFFKWMPKIYGDVKGWQGSNGVLFIEWEIKFFLGSKMISSPAIDKFILKDGLVMERVVYFDPLPLVFGIIIRPQQWIPFLKYFFRKR